MPNILEVKPKITIGTGDLELYVSMILNGTGEVLVDKKADSLVPNFLRLLMSFMSSGDIPAGCFFNSSDNTSYPSVMSDSSESFGAISSVVVGNPTRVNFGSMSRFDNGGEDGLQIMGVGGITPDINGFHDPSDVTFVSTSAADIAIDTTGSPALVDEGARVRLWDDYGTSGQEKDSEEGTFANFVIRVGRNGTANITDQQTLNNEWDTSEAEGDPFEITYNLPTVSSPSFNTSTGVGELFFSAVITNNSGADCDIDEIGLYATGTTDTNDNRYVLIARDIVNTTLSNGSSATVNYRIQTTLDSDGGLLKAFMQALHRQFSQANVTIVDVLDGNHSSDEDFGMFTVVAPSGTAVGNAFGLGYGGEFIGPQIGTGNTAVALDDNKMDSRVAHGDASGEIRHYGALVQNFQIVGSTASLDIVKFFENQSGGTITVAEIGLFTATVNFEGQLSGVVCISRHVLASTVDVDDGEVLKVTYTIELTVA